MHQKKVISKNVTEICIFFTFTHVRQTCFAYNFFGAFFLQLFQRIRNQRELLRFLTPFLIFCKIFFLQVIFVLFQTLKPNAQKTVQKTKKLIQEMCLRFQFCTHQRVCILHFLKKSQIHCTLILRCGFLQVFSWSRSPLQALQREIV